MLHLYHVFIFYSHRLVVLNARRIEDVGKAFQNGVGRVDSSKMPLVEKCHPLTSANLVKIRCRGYDGDTTFLQCTQHVPKLLTTYGINACGGFIEKQHAGTMHQSTAQRQLLLHATRQSARLAMSETFYLLVDGLDGVVTFLNSGSEDGGKELQVFLDGQVLIERELCQAYNPHADEYPSSDLHVS